MIEKISPIEIDENKKVMNNYIFDESKVLRNETFAQLKIDNNTFAYGLLIPKEKDVTDKMGNVVSKEQIWSPVLITSDRQLIEATKENQLKFRIKFESIPSNLPLRWSLESIKSYLEGDDKVPELTPRELLETIKHSSESISSFRNESWYKINPCRDVATYLFILFDSFPIKEERGLQGTGKSKEMKRSKMVSFNSSDIMVNPSESTLFRETHEKRFTKYIDEAEKLFVIQKGKIESDSRVELINGSYSKGSSIPRVEKIGNKFVVIYYQVYSPTTIGSINGLFGATEGRAITQIHTRSLDNDPRGEVEIDEKSPEWRMIRDNLYLFGLKYWKDVQTIYQDISIWKDLKLKKRDLQIWKPILTVAKLVGDDWFKELVDFAVELSEMKLDEMLSESSFDYFCLEALKNTILVYGSNKHYLDKIKESYCMNKPEEEKSNIYLNRNIGQHLKKIGFEKKRDGIGTYIIANKNIFDEIVSPICPQLAFISSYITLSTQDKGKEDKSSVDEVKISVDKENEEVKIVKISVDNVDESKLKGCDYDF